MQSPSDIESDASTIDVSATLSITEQPTALSPSAGIKYDPSNTQPKTLSTSGQQSTLSTLYSIKYLESINPPYEFPASGDRTMRLQPSSIEYGPNDGSSKTPSSPNAEVPATEKMTFYQRVNTQLSEWMFNLYDFPFQVRTATSLAIFNVKLRLLPYAQHLYFAASIMIVSCYLIWGWILLKRFKTEDGSSTEPVLEEETTTELVKSLRSEKSQRYLEIVEKYKEDWIRLMNE